MDRFVGKINIYLHYMYNVYYIINMHIYAIISNYR